MATVTVLNALCDRTGGALRERLESLGHTVNLHHLRDERFAPCVGCWRCWVSHPGSCRARDNANDVMHDIVQCDHLLWLMRPQFGCWDPLSKSALDKTIGLVSPFFQVIDGETHHRRRYDRYATWHVLALGDASSEEDRASFVQLVERNALNMHAGRPNVVFLESEGAPHISDAVVKNVMSVAEPRPARPMEEFTPSLPTAGVPVSGKRRVALWVGSAKAPGRSSSECLGRRLVEGLEHRGWQTDVFHLARSVRLGKGGARPLTDASADADLIILSTPVYIDCLPALVLTALREWTYVRKDDRRPVAILPVVQCGFPETTHTALALSVIERAAREANATWAGHLMAGEGGAIDGRAVEIGGRLTGKARAMDRAVEELDGGAAVSADTTRAFAEPIIPHGLYRIFGQVGWIADALRHSAASRLWDRPFEGNGQDPQGNPPQ